jgi:hypothetical protein
MICDDGFLSAYISVDISTETDRSNATIKMLTTFLILSLATIHVQGFVIAGSAPRRQDTLTLGVTASDKSQLAQLAGMTTLSIDSGDLKVIEDYAKTGYITDATTNPLFVSQVSSAFCMLRFVRFYT